ncbi:MAG: hypothetical protein PVI08_08295 [Gammaproteobacteria bacterium]|jgi:hypothetical protein
MSADIRLLVGTKKGLFRLHGDAGMSRWSMDGPHIEGYEVIHTAAHPARPGTFYAAVTHPVWGAHIYASRDGGGTWASLAGVPRHEDARYGTDLKSIWYLAHTPDGRRMYAGIDPAGLFFSDDEGETWQPADGLNDHPTNVSWEPSRGIFAVHSIHIDPADPTRVWAAISAGGVYRSEDGGQSWRPANTGVRAENLPNRFPETGHNVHRLVMHPRQSSRLYRQCYNGTYRSDDGGDTWTEITAGLPSDFGYALVTDPADPDTVFQIPESSSHLRAPVDGRLRVFQSRDAGATWASVSPVLPQEHVYVTVLREAMDADDRAPCGLYFGTSGGHLFAASEAGAEWRMIAGFLPRILSVKAHSISEGR